MAALVTQIFRRRIAKPFASTCSRSGTRSNEFRAEGSENKERIEARAEREVTVLTAEANCEARILRGEGEAEQTRILGDAFGQDPDLFGF